eukprot:g43280.t1
MSQEGDEETVFVYLYDISHGMASALSMQFVGKQLDGIWHTGLVVYGYEYYYGGGIQAAPPGQTLAGQPLRKIEIGKTKICQEAFHDYLHSVSHRFSPSTYSLLKHNCNNFTQEACKFLTGKDIPSYITGLPEEALSTPMGQMFRPMIEQMEASVRGEVPGATRGFIPWQEEDGQQIMLPPIRKPSKTYKKGTFTAAHVVQEQKVEKALANVNLNGVVSGENHKHKDLKLQIIGSNNKPALSKDLKEKIYLGLIKLAGKKQMPNLTPAQIAILTKAAAPDALTEPQALAVASIFDAIITSWEPATLYAVLGLFRLLLLQPAFLRIYGSRFAATESKSGSVAHVPKADPVLQRLSALIQPGASATPEVPVRTKIKAYNALGNLFAFRSASSPLAPMQAVVALQPGLLKASLATLSCEDEQLRLAAAKFVYNLALVLPKDDGDAGLEAVEMLVQAVEKEEDPVTCLRLLYALGELCFCNSGSALVLSVVHGFDPNQATSRYASKVVPAVTAKNLEKIKADLQLLMSAEATD